MSAVRYDPFLWRLEQLQPAASHAVQSNAQTATLVAELLVAEAEELAHGRRHLTIEHGPLEDVVEHDQRQLLLEAIDALTSTSQWRRITVTSRYVTVTVTGADATRVLNAVVHQALADNPGGWRITASARPTTP